MANELNQNQLLQYLSTIRLKGSPWEKVPQNKFLLHFDERLRLWNEHSDDPFSDGMKVRLLQQAILGVPNLDKVYTTHTSAIKSASGTGKLHYEEYLRLLIEQADVHDIDSTVCSPFHQ